MNTRTPLEAVQEATLLAEQLVQTCCIVNTYGGGLVVMPWSSVCERNMRARVIETVHPVESVASDIRRSVVKRYQRDGERLDAIAAEKQDRIRRLKANPLQVAI